MESVENFVSKNYLITDGGIETHMIYLMGIPLNDFALFELLDRDEGCDLLNKLYKSYLDIALSHKISIIIGSPTWRANANWMKKMGYQPSDVFRINEQATTWTKNFRSKNQTSLDKAESRFIVGGDVGPAGDGYVIGEALDIHSAYEHYLESVKGLKSGGAELIQAITMTYEAEAIGVVKSAQTVNLPCNVMFTVEVDGKLPNGHTLNEAIKMVEAETNGYPAWYAVNCAHPEHIRPALVG